MDELVGDAPDEHASQARESTTADDDEVGTALLGCFNDGSRNLSGFGLKKPGGHPHAVTLEPLDGPVDNGLGLIHGLKVRGHAGLGWNEVVLMNVDNLDRGACLSGEALCSCQR